jgi:hypothetical protein
MRAKILHVDRLTLLYTNFKSLTPSPTAITTLQYLMVKVRQFIKTASNVGIKPSVLILSKKLVYFIQICCLAFEIRLRFSNKLILSYK